MVFRFTQDQNNSNYVINMALEATYSDGSKAQSMYVYARRGQEIHKVLVYRDGNSGRWLNTEGISFNGLARTPDNLVRALGRSEPTAETYVMPEE